MSHEKYPRCVLIWPPKPPAYLNEFLVSALPSARDQGTFSSGWRKQVRHFRNHPSLNYHLSFDNSPRNRILTHKPVVICSWHFRYIYPNPAIHDIEATSQRVLYWIPVSWLNSDSSRLYRIPRTVVQQSSVLREEKSTGAVRDLLGRSRSIPGTAKNQQWILQPCFTR